MFSLPFLAVSSYTTASKASIRSQTEYLPKLMDSSAISNVRTDELFTNVLIQRDRKVLKKKDMGVTRSDQLRYSGQVSGPRIEHCEEIFICATSDERSPKRILLTGKAGIGKTLFCQKLLRDWAYDKLFQSQASLKIPDFKFAYLLTFRQLNLLENGEFSLQELLNRSTVLDDRSNVDDSLLGYIVEHPEEVMIIIDGYDEYSQQDYIAGRSEEQYPNSTKDNMPVAALCTKLIKGKLLRDSVVMITSRPDESDKMGGIPFDLKVEIAGFSPKQVQEYIEKYFRENEAMKNAVLDHVMKNENLVSFAHIPFLCFLMCYYMEHALQTSKSSDDLLVSATDIYSKVVNIFELKHNAASEYRTKALPEKFKAQPALAKSTLDKLSEFAAQLLFEKKPVFEERDMEEKFLPEEINKLKGSGLLHCGPPFRKSAFETAKYFNFTHPSIQEYLAARWFERELRDEIPTDVPEMVVQFMAGILSKNKSGELLMAKLLEGISSSFSSGHVLLRAKCLSEYQEKEFVKNAVKNHPQHYSQNGELEFSNLDDADCIAISFLLDVLSALNEEEATTAQHQRSEHSFTVRSLSIARSSLTLSGIKRICKSLKNECCPVTELSFRDVRLTDECVDCISRLVCRKLTALRMTKGGITSVASLCDALKGPNCKVTTLDLRRNQITVEGVTSLSNVLQCSSCKVTTLGLTESQSNQLIDTGFGSLCNALQQPSCKVITLDLSFCKFSVTNFGSLCEALKQSSGIVTRLNLTHCQITDTDVTVLCNALQHPSCTVTTLDLSFTPLIRDARVASLCNTLKQSSCKVTRLDLTCCRITDTGVSSLCNALQHSSCKVTILDLSGNRITDTGVSSLCNGLQHSSCKVTILDLSGNRITDAGVTSLCEAVQRDKWKLVTLDLGGNRGVSEGSKQSLRYVVEQHKPGFELLM